MTDGADQMAADIEMARRILYNLCTCTHRLKGEYSLKMTIPPQQNDDDIVLFRVINYAEDAMRARVGVKNTDLQELK